MLQMPFLSQHILWWRIRKILYLGEYDPVINSNCVAFKNSELP